MTDRLVWRRGGPFSRRVGRTHGYRVRDPSQVVGAALTSRQIYADDAVLRVATVTKLTRNPFSPPSLVGLVGFFMAAVLGRFVMLQKSPPE